MTPKDPKQPPAHSFSMILNMKPSDELSPENAEAYSKGTRDVFDQILDTIKAFLKENETIKELKKNNVPWKAFVDSIKPMYDYQKDKETGDVIPGAQPTLFAKLKVKPNGTIKTVFQQIQYESGDIAQIEEIDPSELPQRFQGVKCMAMGVIHIESIFISKTNNISIQYKLDHALITEVIKAHINRLVIPTYTKSRINKLCDDSGMTSVLNDVSNTNTNDVEEEQEEQQEPPRRIIQRKH
jgi:hypothetical protein